MVGLSDCPLYSLMRWWTLLGPATMQNEPTCVGKPPGVAQRRREQIERKFAICTNEGNEENEGSLAQIRTGVA